jgi:hypothetical protein
MEVLGLEIFKTISIIRDNYMVKNAYTGRIVVGFVVATVGIVGFTLVQKNHVANSQKQETVAIQSSSVDNKSLAGKATNSIGSTAHLSSSQIKLEESAPSSASNSDNLMAKLWTAYNQAELSGNVEYANKGIQYANQCLSQNQANADKEQAKLKQQGEPLPAKGEPSSDEEFQTIVSREALNDTATCFWLRGNLAKLTGKLDIAKESYKKATQYTYGRTLDARGVFLSPSDNSAEKLNSM